MKYVVKEAFSIDKLEENKELRSDVMRAIDSSNAQDEEGEETEETKLAKLKARLSRVKLEGMVKSDIEVLEKGASNRNKIICVIHAYIYVANQTLWRKLNNVYGETDIRSSKDLLWYRSIIIKRVDNVTMMSKGDKAQHAASQLEKVKAYKVSNVQQIGKLITKLIEVNKLYSTYGIEAQTDEALVNIVLNSVSGIRARSRDN